MKLDRNEAIEVIKQSHKLVNIFVDQQKQLQQIEKTQNTKHTDLASEVEEFWKRFIDYMVIFSSSQVDLSKIGGLKRWNELIQKWGEDYRRIFKQPRDTTYIHMMIFHTGDMLQRIGGVQKFGCFSLESKHIVTDEIHHHQSNNSDLSSLEVLSNHLLLEQYHLPVPARQNHHQWHFDLVDQVHKDLRPIIVEK
jgi:hypothetical protein